MFLARTRCHILLALTVRVINSIIKDPVCETKRGARGRETKHMASTDRSRPFVCFCLSCRGTGLFPSLSMPRYCLASCCCCCYVAYFSSFYARSFFPSLFLYFILCLPFVLSCFSYPASLACDVSVFSVLFAITERWCSALRTAVPFCGQNYS